METVRKRVRTLHKGKRAIKSYVQALRAERGDVRSPETAADQIVKKALRNTKTKFKLTEHA